MRRSGRAIRGVARPLAQGSVVAGITNGVENGVRQRLRRTPLSREVARDALVEPLRDAADREPDGRYAMRRRLETHQTERLRPQ